MAAASSRKRAWRASSSHASSTFPHKPSSTGWRGTSAANELQRATRRPQRAHASSPASRSRLHLGQVVGVPMRRPIVLWDRKERVIFGVMETESELFEICAQLQRDAGCKKVMV